MKSMSCPVDDCPPSFIQTAQLKYSLSSSARSRKQAVMADVQRTSREDSVEVRSPYAGHKDRFRALDDMTRASASNGAETMPRLVQARLGSLLQPGHGRRDGADPASVGVDDPGPDRGAFEETELRSGLFGQTLADRLARGQDHARLAGRTADWLVLGRDLRRCTRSVRLSRQSSSGRTNSGRPILLKNSSFQPLLPSTPGGTYEHLPDRIRRFSSRTRNARDYAYTPDCSCSWRGCRSRGR